VAIEPVRLALRVVSRREAWLSSPVLRSLDGKSRLKNLLGRFSRITCWSLSVAMPLYTFEGKRLLVERVDGQQAQLFACGSMLIKAWRSSAAESRHGAREQLQAWGTEADFVDVTRSVFAAGLSDADLVWVPRQKCAFVSARVAMAWISRYGTIEDVRSAATVLLPPPLDDADTDDDADNAAGGAGAESKVAPRALSACFDALSRQQQQRQLKALLARLQASGDEVDRKFWQHLVQRFWFGRAPNISSARVRTDSARPQQVQGQRVARLSEVLSTTSGRARDAVAAQSPASMATASSGASPRAPAPAAGAGGAAAAGAAAGAAAVAGAAAGAAADAKSPAHGSLTPLLALPAAVPVSPRFVLRFIPRCQPTNHQLCSCSGRRRSPGLEPERSAADDRRSVVAPGAQPIVD
jgi:hypothetical protein